MLDPTADGKMAKAGLMPNPTTKERVRKFRAKAKEGGLVRFECYVTPEQKLYLQSKVAAMKAKKK